MTPEIEVTEVSLGDIDLLDVGNAIGLAGAIYTGQGKTMLVPFPGMTIHVDAVTYSFVKAIVNVSNDGFDGEQCCVKFSALCRCLGQ